MLNPQKLNPLLDNCTNFGNFVGKMHALKEALREGIVSGLADDLNPETYLAD